MSDINVRLKFTEDVSQKMKKAASATKAATQQISAAGKEIDKAFKTSSLDSFSSKVGKVVSQAGKEVEGLGNAIDDALKTSGNAKIGVEVNSAAASALDDIENRAATLDGTSVDVGVAADDGASPIIDGVKDKVSDLDGQSGSPELGVDDSASPLIDGVRDKISGLDGISASPQIGAEDNASPILDSVKDKATEWDGSVWEATVSIVDGVTAPMTSLVNLARNPIAQAGTMLGVGVGVNDIKDTYADFESTMSRVQALANASGSEMDALTEKAKEMGAVTKYSGTESAEAFTYMAQAGWDTQSMIDGSGGIMSLAASDGIALADATDIVANALTSFGLTASDTSRFADVLAVASSATNTDVAQLGEAFKYVAPVAGAMGYAIEDVSTALGLMSNNGIKGSMAGTSLKSSLANLAAPTDKMRQVMDKYGISLTDNEGNMKSLSEVLDNLREGMGGLSESEQTAAASMLFGKEAMAGMLSIINTSEEDYRSLQEQIDNSTGAADRMAETMQDNMAGTLEQLGGAIETVELSWGERMEPYITDGANALANAMPAIERMGLDVFDTLDKAYGGLKNNITEMMDSEEWQSADLIGKVNIAWDKIIAEPFKEWAGTTGKSMISDGLATLFSESVKILPGGQEAGLTSWLSTGLIAKGGTTLISGAGSLAKTLKPIASGMREIGTAAKAAPTVGAFFSSLLSMIPVAGQIGLVVGGIAAAVAGVAVAIDQYNKKQIKGSLGERFGDLELTSEQIEQAASHILNADYLVNVNGALNEFENADELAAQAEEALAANDALEWKASIGAEWDEGDVNDYVDNINTYIESSVSELESRTYAATITVQTMLGGTNEGQLFTEQLEQWAGEDQLEMNALSEQLSTAVEKAMTDGVLDANEQAAISILQTKMNNILSSWKEADTEASMDLMAQKYGSMSGEDLTSDTFTDLIDELGKQREEAMKAVDEASTEAYGVINSQVNKGRLSETEGDRYKGLVAEAARNMEADTIQNSVDFERDTLQDTYGDVLDRNYFDTKTDIAAAMPDIRETFASGDTMQTARQLEYAGNIAESYSGMFSSSDQKALSDIYSNMQPDVEAMSGIMEEYKKAGQAVPQEFMDSFNEAMKLGAAAGDADAAWQMYASQMVADPANNALIQAIQDGTQNAPEELRNALDIATMETTSEPVEMEGLSVALSGLDLDVGQIAELTGMTEEEVQSYLNQYGVNVETSAKVDAKTEAGEIDASGASQIGQEAEAMAQEQTGQDIQTTQDVDVTQEYKVGEKDTSQLGEESEKLPSKTAEQDVYVTENVISDGTSQSAESQTYETTATVNVNSQMGTDNFTPTASSFASKFQSALSAAFAKTFTTTTNARIHVNYSIANPTKTITFSGGGTGTATVTAHASGGIFDEPHYGLVAEAGPEAIIPLDGSDNAMSLWAQAGEHLGMIGGDAPITTMPNMPHESGTGSGDGEKSTSRDINININGSGNLRVSGGMSKDDVVAILMEKARDIISDIVEQDILMEGDGVYEY